MGDHRPVHVDHAEEICVKKPLGILRLSELDGPADAEAGVVHHHVDVALLPQYLPDGGVHQLLTGDVRHQMVQALYPLRPAAQLIYRIARRLQRQSRLLSDTGGSSGDNRYLTHALPAPPP